MGRYAIGPVARLAGPRPIMTLPIPVLTPTIHPRVEVFAQFRRDVAAQTVQPVEHLWISEEPAWGDHEVHVKALVRVHNELLRWAERRGYEWVVTADDDDRWYPDHLETLWRTHLEHPDCQIVYALTAPKATWHQNPHGANANQALLHLPSILAVGGYVYHEGANEDVLADHYWVTQCGLNRTYCDHPTYEWVRGGHLHAIDVYKESDPRWAPDLYEAERQREPIDPKYLAVR